MLFTEDKASEELRRFSAKLNIRCPQGYPIVTHKSEAEPKLTCCEKSAT